MLTSRMVWAGEARPQKGDRREKGAEEDEEQGIPSPLRPRLAYLQLLPLTLSASEALIAIAEPGLRFCNLGIH